MKRVLINHRTSSRISIADALSDPRLLGAALDDLDTWHVWMVVLRAAFGLGLNRAERRLFSKIAGSRQPPEQRVEQLWCLIGRRSGKTRVAAAICVFIACIEQHRLAPGEVGYVLLLAMSRDQAGLAFSYVLGFIERSPILRQQVEKVTADEVHLKGGVVIGVHSNSFRTVRGKTLLAVVADECSFWRSEESAVPDFETFRACLPSLAATNGLWIAISSGYRKSGLLFERWRDHFGKDSDDVLVIQGATELFNPTFSKKKIKKAMADDPEAAAAEWLGQFRNDVSAFLSDSDVDAAIDHARPLELPPKSGIRYSAFTDVSGGRKDHFTLAIGHREGDRCIVDVVRGVRPPLNPQEVVADYAKLLHEYGVHKLRGDNYAAAWAETAWRGADLLFEKSEIAKSQIYLETLPHWTRRLVSIPDYQRLTRELRLLERTPHKGGRDVVDHARRGGSDDYANSACGLIHMLTAKQKSSYLSDLSWVQGDEEAPSYISHWQSRHMRLFGT